MISKQISCFCKLKPSKKELTDIWYISVFANNFNSEEEVKYECTILENFGFQITAFGVQNNKFLSAKMEGNLEKIRAAHWELLKNWVEPKPDPYELDLYNPDHIFAWKDIYEYIGKGNSFTEEKVLDAKERYLNNCPFCPKCGKKAEELNWQYFVSPPWTWEGMFGRGGWLVICDACKKQVHFFCESMN